METTPFEPVDLDAKDLTFDDIVGEIVRLDEAYEQGLIEREEHRQQRRELLLQAKKIFPEEFK